MRASVTVRYDFSRHFPRLGASREDNQAVERERAARPCTLRARSESVIIREHIREENHAPASRPGSR